MDEKKRRTWAGGYIRKMKGGRDVYVIERRALGGDGRKSVRVHVSTGCSTKRAAEKELERFELDPINYEPNAIGGGVTMTAELIDGYRKHMLAKGLTEEWAYQVGRNLADWAEALGGRDLRTLKLHRDLRPALDGWPTQAPHRIKAIKGFFRWLRQERGLVERSQDATLDLRVPQAKPEKLTRKKVVAPEDVAAVLKALPAATRDVLHLLSATGWHISEVRKFHAHGELTTPINSEGVLAVIITRHKSGDIIKTPLLYPEHVEAAKRIKALERFPTRKTVALHMKQACKVAGVPWFGAGQMRHSVITWGVRDGGATVEQVKEFAGHRSDVTTKRFYLDLDVPKSAIPVYRLLD